MNPTRRDVLQFFLGAPAAASCSRLRPRPVEGEIVGATVALGHRLRDGAVDSATELGERVQVAIVGSGPSGLSAAWRLAQLGVRDLVVFELEAQPGGTSTYGTEGVVPHPWGAHYVPVPADGNRALARLLGEMGALDAVGPPMRAAERLRIRAPEERLFFEGRWHQGLLPDAAMTEQDTLQLERFEAEVARWVGFRDARGRRAFTIPMALGSDAPEVAALDGVSAAAWLDERGFVAPMLRWWLDYACRDDYGARLGDVSAWALLFYFAARVPEPGGPSAPFIAWPEGNGRIVRHLSAPLGDRLKTGQVVVDVGSGPEAAELIVSDGRTGRLRRVIADHVIMAVPRFVAKRVVRGLRQAPPGGAVEPEFSYGAWLVANLHLRRAPRGVGFPMAWDNVLHESPALGYVTATHQALRDRGPTVLTYYHPLADETPDAGRARLLGLSHAEIADAVLADLGRAHRDMGDLVTRLDVWRWGHAMVRPTPGFVCGGARERAAAPIGRVHFAHSDLSGVALFEEAQYRGVMAAEAVAVARGGTITSLYG